MLTGVELGAAIEEARTRKGVSKRQLADAMGVRPPSVQDWVKRGTIEKNRLQHLMLYFADVCSPAHWGLTEVLAPVAASTRGSYAFTPPLSVALPVVLDALEACPHTAELERLLPLLPTGAPAYRERLAQLLGVEVAHAPAVAPTAPAVAPAPPRPDLARHRSQAGTHGFKPPPVPGGPARTPSAAGPAESSAGSVPEPRPAE